MPTITYENSVTADLAIVTTAETVAVTVSGVSLPRAGVPVVVTGWAQVTTGAGTTALTPRVRRGATITDPVVGDAVAEEIEAIAGSDEGIYIQVHEAPGELAGASYSLTIQQAAATGNGTILQAGLRVEVLG